MMPMPMTRRRSPITFCHEDMHVDEGNRDDIREAGRARALVCGGPAVMSGEWTGWERRESGPGGAKQRALLLPGGMCTAVQYEELMAEPALAGVRMVAVTVPGMGGTPAPKDLSIENLARLAAQCAADLGCDVVVGFSMGANIALEMAASGAFRGPLV